MRRNPGQIPLKRENGSRDNRIDLRRECRWERFLKLEFLK